MKITSIAMQEYRWPRNKAITNGKHTYIMSMRRMHLSKLLPTRV